MTRVLWLVPQGQGWLGGVNYYRNLMLALLALPDCCIKPVVDGNPATLPAPLNQCEAFIRNALYPKTSWKGFWARVARKLFRREIGLEHSMRFQNIPVLSHTFGLLANSKHCVEICWIPDFQHIHLPEFFSPTERAHRDTAFFNGARFSRLVILSSEDAKKDFVGLFPEHAHKARVLSFVAPPPDMTKAPELAEVMARYEIDEPYIHIPNQLWIHKNHKVAIKALGILKRETGTCPLVISTGHTEDYRHPGFFAQMQELAKSEGVEERIRFLGVVPYADLAVLMREALCMLNPSLFEGWSTTVEEAKSMGKKLILSDIPVHIEQNPERGVFFKALDPQDLAQKIVCVLGDYNADEEKRAAQDAAARLPERMAAYGRRYQQIILEALQ